MAHTHIPKAHLFRLTLQTSNFKIASTYHPYKIPSSPVNASSECSSNTEGNRARDRQTYREKKRERVSIRCGLYGHMASVPQEKLIMK